ncbi:hypothetical protein [Priestia megaterium]|nr:hypothetical protein [Priestia megaterium]
MPHQTTLAGSAIVSLREYDYYVSFDVREKGSTSALEDSKRGPLFRTPFL